MQETKELFFISFETIIAWLWVKGEKSKTGRALSLMPSISGSTSKNNGYVIEFFKGCLVPDMGRHCWYCHKLIWCGVIFMKPVMTMLTYTPVLYVLFSINFKRMYERSTPKRGQPYHVLCWGHQWIFSLGMFLFLGSQLNLWQCICILFIYWVFSAAEHSATSYSLEVLFFYKCRSPGNQRCF